MTSHKEPFAQVRGFCICEGSVEGVVHISTEPYKDDAKLTSNSILVLEYPASTFLRLMRKAGGVIADRGTDKIEAAKFLAHTGKPVFFGGDLSKRLCTGTRIRLDVFLNNTALVYFA
jgi:phosphohistidine swiveling domain-containing protein